MGTEGRDNMSIRKIRDYLKKHSSKESRSIRVSCPKCGGAGCRVCSNGLIMPLK